MEISNINAYSDSSLLQAIGEFIRAKRLEQNKSQAALSKEAGINRSTLSEFEKGGGATMDTFIRLLRVLHLLPLLEPFRAEPQISPIQLAEMQMAMRKRASKTKTRPKKPTSNW